MREKYDRINWVNGDESLATPLSADNLNRMDKAIFEISETMDDLNLDAKAEEIRSLVVQAQDYSAAAEESAKKAMSTTPEGYEKIALAVRTNELAYLGWSVPYEMPIQNYVDANRVFHQRVGRVDLGTLTYVAQTSTQGRYDSSSLANVKAFGFSNLYCSKYKTLSDGSIVDKSIRGASVNGNIVIIDTSMATNTQLKESLKGVYLYYELATEITFNADGNEKITSLEKHFEVNNFSVPHENINLVQLPYVDGMSRTTNGITFTVNADDGSVTANGTATANAYFMIRAIDITSETYTLYGGAEGGSNDTFMLFLQTKLNGVDNWLQDYGNGVSGNRDAGTANCRILIKRGYTCNNLVFRPRLVKGTEIPNCIGWENSSALVDKALGKNLLNTTFTTTTIGGVTCESLGNGTYRLNGTASGNVSFWIIGSDTEYPLFLNGKYKMIGFKNPTTNRTVQAFNAGLGKSVLDTSRGVINPITNVSSDYFRVRIYCGSGEVFNNEIVKPMLVNADLYPNVTYDDFEKWQGLTSADSQKYTKYAKIETDKYGADFIPQYVDYLPNGFCFTDSEQDDLSLLENGVHFLDDGILLLAESTPTTDVNLRIGGVV